MIYENEKKMLLGIVVSKNEECSTSLPGSRKELQVMNRLFRILTKMATGSACCNVFRLHVRHVEASHLKLAKGLGSDMH